MNEYLEESVKVGDLTIDHRVQRAAISMDKVDAMVKGFDSAAIGLITVSRRENGEQVVIDGWHRVTAVRRLTSNQGEVPCRIFTGLTLQEEARMFLHLNATNQPKLFDRWKVRVTEGDPVALEATETLRHFGWSVGNQVADGVMVAIGSLERIYSLSEKAQIEPNLVHAVIMVITRAWGHNRYGVVSPIFEGLGRLIAEHGSKVNLATLISTLKEYKGGPQSLHQEARVLAGLRNIRIPMAVADLVTERYNKGKRTNELPPWRKRT